MIQREKQLIRELETLDSVESVRQLEGHVLELVDHDCLIILGGDRLGPGQMRDILSDEVIHRHLQVLVVLEDLILDLGRTPIVAYSEGHSIDDTESIASHIGRILSGTSSPDEVPFEREGALRQIQEAGLLSFQTPAAAAELLINWTISGNPDSILNPGHGTGQFLVKIRDRIDGGPESPGPSLFGIDTSEIACQMAKARLGESATIWNEDFLEFGTGDGQPTLSDFDVPHDGEDSLSNGASSVAVSEPAVSDVDAVISHLPSVRLDQLPSEVKARLRERFGYNRLDQAFVLRSLSLLRPGGRGAFLIPQSSLTDSFVETVSSLARLHGFARLSSSEFLTQGIEPALLFLEKIEAEQPSTEPIRLLRIDSSEITDRHTGLLHGPSEGAIARSESMDDVAMSSVSSAALDADLLPLALSGPRASSFLFSEAFGELSDVASPHTGLQTGDNAFFYFDQQEIDDSGIPREFFTPVLRKHTEVTGRVSLDEINHYLLDLRELVDTARHDEEFSTLSDFLDWLERNDQPELHEYLTDHKSFNTEFRNEGIAALIPHDLTERVWNPELVAQSIFDQPRWLLVDIDEDVVFDTTMIGLVTNDEVPPEALWALLNTPLYKRLQFDSSPPLRNNASYSRFLIRDLRNLPIIESCLTNQFAEDIGPMVPTDSAHQQIEIQNRIIEACDPDERGAVDSAFKAFSQDALSWFLSGTELRELSNRIENDESPGEFLVNQFGEDVIDDVERMYSRVSFFEGREEILLDLVELFEAERYQTFLVGLAPQFEGVLVDYIQATGGRVVSETRSVEQDGEMTEIEVYVFYPSGSQQGKRKDLKRLFDEFFEGEYLRFLQEKVRERRNELTHGTVMDEPGRLAVMLFVAFFAMTNSVLHSYNQHLARMET